MTKPFTSNRSFAPLSLLTAAEIRAVSNTARAHFAGEELRFCGISLFERRCATSASSHRHAEAIVLRPELASAVTLRFSLSESTPSVISCRPVTDAQPPLSPADCLLAEDIVKSDERIAEILKERCNIKSPNDFVADPWSVHVVREDAPELHWRSDGASARLVLCFLYAQTNGPGDNPYAHPLPITPVVDLNAECVVHVHGDNSIYGTGSPVQEQKGYPMANVNYHREGLKENTYLPRTFRNPSPAPLNLVQPSGPSFTVDDDFISWQKWELRVAFTAREGLVLRNMSYDGRPVLNRASIVEMAVPYGEPRGHYAQKCAFDVGDYGLGYCATSLKLGCDCLGCIHYFDALLADEKGEPYIVQSAVCLHEEDAGILWKHVDYRSGHSEARRARRLVLSFIATVVNYEYLFYWYLSLDGTLSFEVKLSGELSTNVLSAKEVDPQHGTLVAPGVNAQVHQHMFCARLDMSIDGPLNSVDEIDVVPGTPDASIPNKANSAFHAKSSRLRTEKQAVRDAAPQQARSWRINSSQRINSITHRNTAYRLVPQGPQTALLVAPSSAVATRAGFAHHALWVTRFDEEQRFPAGEFPTQRTEADGLPKWINRDANVENEDIVLWHTFGIVHVPRVEDFPVMNCESIGFSLKPDGFFDGNDAIDLPPEVDRSSACCGVNGRENGSVSAVRNAAGTASLNGE